MIKANGQALLTNKNQNKHKKIFHQIESVHRWILYIVRHELIPKFIYWHSHLLSLKLLHCVFLYYIQDEDYIGRLLRNTAFSVMRFCFIDFLWGRSGEHEINKDEMQSPTSGRSKILVQEEKTCYFKALYFKLYKT